MVPHPYGTDPPGLCIHTSGKRANRVAKQLSVVCEVCARVGGRGQAQCSAPVRLLQCTVFTDAGKLHMHQSRSACVGGGGGCGGGGYA